MTYRDFCYWLQGFFELAETPNLTPHQVDLIKRHLDMVFVQERPQIVPNQIISDREARIKC